jgi:hypothetical protein
LLTAWLSSLYLALYVNVKTVCRDIANTTSPIPLALSTVEMNVAQKAAISSTRTPGRAQGKASHEYNKQGHHRSQAELHER